jgi:hypothetical protein
VVVIAGMSDMHCRPSLLLLIFAIAVIANKQLDLRWAPGWIFVLNK